MLGSSHQPLDQAFDLVMLDLDGVVYIDGDAVPGASSHLERTRASGARLAFITNNASRTPDTVAAHLRSLGVEAAPEDVVTSAQAASRVLLERHGTGAAVVLLGADGLRAALESDGLVPVGVEDDAVALVTGYGPDVLWRDVMRAAVRVREGLPWVASNTDLSIPTAYGVAPGHGVLVDTIRRFAGVGPVVAGKPERPLLDETVRRVGGTRPLMVGDRLDTDIEGARRIGIDSLLVLTGVTGLAELVSAPAPLRPTYLGTDLGALGTPHEAPRVADGVASLGGWTASAEEGRLVVRGDGDAESWWRAVAVAAWAHLDATGVVIDTAGLAVPSPGAVGPQR
ncbi:HAD-IIA family hydrolase [Nocardioides ochotonae]|uniref:HAD-IIA family hydrolase n=1 Tax=Nocardioides ochotonae TaxID=2685869 RepID=UPI00140CE4C1|nr:HAD-IIA family hydrolase [Nocardioides ochotonae]